jgi:hypothetical protein
MGRIRTIKPELFKHEDLFELEKRTGLPMRLAWMGLFTLADREGRFHWRPRAMQTDVLPYDQGINFSDILSALVDAKLVVRYEVDGKFYGYIPTWHVHQVIRKDEAQSRIPAPPGWKPPEPVTDPLEPVTNPHRGRGIGRGKGNGVGGEGAGAPETPPADSSPGEDFGILPELAGNSKREQVLPQIPRSVQQEWIDKYDPGWLKDSLVHAIEHYCRGAPAGDVRDWPEKLARWFKIEKKPKLRAKPRPARVKDPPTPWPTGKSNVLSDPRLQQKLAKVKSV